MIYCLSDSENIAELIYFFADDFSLVWPETAAMRTKRTGVEKWNDVLIDSFCLLSPLVCSTPVCRWKWSYPPYCTALSQQGTKNLEFVF